ncbi:TIGR03943 family putative permease subunit [Bacillus songklensis]|uniref:TIGR03943 family putative permease subunit n=1 Tax=Bacillus songklensis TaxID=1069116 RepID=A0ABV8B9U9_9BACI
MNKQIDYSFQAYIRGIILIGFSLLMFKLLLTGDIQLFIAPRMLPFIEFAAFTFFMMGILQIWRSSSKNEQDLLCQCGFSHGEETSPIQSSIIYALFILPVMTGFVFANHSLDSSVAAKRGIKFGANVTSQPTPEERQELINNAQLDTSEAEQYLQDPQKYMQEMEEKVKKEVAQENQTNGTKDVPLSHPDGYVPQQRPEEYYERLEQTLLEKDRIEVTEEQYIPTMTIIDENAVKFVGKKIELTGFVYREEGFTKDQFVVARFGLSCCVADASVYGTLATMENAKTYKTDEWIKVEGTLLKTTYNDSLLPYIHIEHIERIEPPKNPYVYEFYEGEQLIAP